MNLIDLHNNLKNCNICNKMYNSRKESMGDINFPISWYSSNDAKYMIIGLAPGRMKIKNDEKNFNLYHAFFKGSGKILLRCLNDLNLKKEDFHITNIVKCITPKDKKFIDIEVQTCINMFLLNEISIINPQKIIVLGKKAEEYIKKYTNITNYSYVYHPAYVMRGFMKYENYFNIFKLVI